MSMLNPWNPEPRGLSPFGLLQREIERVFDDVGRRLPLGARAEGRLVPSLDVYESDKGIDIAVELPGVEEGDVEVTLEGDVLSIRGEKKTETKIKERSYHVEERSYGAFQRMLRLPFSPDPSAIEARFKAGVLNIHLPKPEGQEGGPRKIEVRGEGTGEGAGEAASAGSAQRGAQQQGGGI